MSVAFKKLSKAHQDELNKVTGVTWNQDRTFTLDRGLGPNTMVSWNVGSHEARIGTMALNQFSIPLQMKFL